MDRQPHPSLELLCESAYHQCPQIALDEDLEKNESKGRETAVLYRVTAELLYIELSCLEC